jgi:hypothetical protein
MGDAGISPWFISLFLNGILALSFIFDNTAISLSILDLLRLNGSRYAT